MATIRIAIDNIQNYSADKKTLDAIASKLREAGHTVTTHGVGPNTIQSVARKSSNKCDLAIQIAGGKCLGTLCDFYVGIGGYYHAEAMGFMYFKCYSATWPAKREPRDHFSTKPGTQVKAEADKMTGKTLPEIFKLYKPKMYFGYGDNAEDCVKTFLQDYTGKSSGTDASATFGGGGSDVLSLIKEVASDLDPYGAELQLNGDTISFKRTNPNKSTLLNEAVVVNNSVNITDYDNSTPNSYGKIKNNELIKRFGEIPLELPSASSWEDQVLLMGQRKHGHTVELKCIFNPKYLAGNWVLLDLPSFNINKRPYYVTKSNFDDERQLSITLEPGPPSLYVEKMEVTDEEINLDEEVKDE